MENKKIEITDFGAIALSRAILRNAGDCYLKLSKSIRDEPDDKKCEAWKSDLKRIIKFFGSDWYYILTDTNPDYVFRKLNEAVGRGETSIDNVGIQWE